jgi:hypothetical protein
VHRLRAGTKTRFVGPRTRCPFPRGPGYARSGGEVPGRKGEGEGEGCFGRGARKGEGKAEGGVMEWCEEW